MLNSTRDEKVETNRIEEILVSNSSLVSGLSEASRARFSLVEVSQKVRKKPTDNDYWVTRIVLFPANLEQNNSHSPLRDQ